MSRGRRIVWKKNRVRAATIIRVRQQPTVIQSSRTEHRPTISVIARFFSFVRDRMWWTVGAVVCGVARAAFASSVLSTLLYGVSAVDRIAFGGVAFVMCATVYAAAWLPARRAARVDPMVALRCE
jgi:hypothetical protein